MCQFLFKKLGVSNTSLTRLVFGEYGYVKIYYFITKS